MRTKTDIFHPTIWYGVVEDNVDPEKRGRVRVRIFGIHTEDKQQTKTTGIPTDHLPWAEISASAQNPMVNGIGISWVLPQGTWVEVEFIDDAFQRPKVIRTVASGVPSVLPNPEIGFNDPDAVYPKADFIGEPDINRLTRNEKIDETYVQTRKDNKKTGIETAGGGSWDEPDPAYAAEYPHNKVIETESGIVIEMDDTEGNERINIWHPSGSYIEIDSSGAISIRSGDKTEINTGDRKLSVDGDQSTTVDGNVKLKVNGYVNVECEDIRLGKSNNPLKGLVTGDSIDPFTRRKHIDTSNVVKAKK